MHRKIVRSDGSVIILVPRRESKSVTWEVMYKVGSRQEQRAINGASHFIEHMMFKGTRRRPSTQVLSRELDAIGAEYNAFTGKDHTAFYIQSDAAHMKLGIDMLSDMIHDSLFDKKEMDRERKVIVEELNMYRDNPLMRIEELFEEVMFRGSSLGWEIGGPKEVVQKLPHQRLVSFKQKNYYNGNVVIGIAGNFAEHDVLTLIDRYFPFERKKTRATIRKYTFTQQRPRVTVEYKDTEQVQLMLGFPGFSRTHPRADALMLLSVILGGNMSSRLFITIRERKGLAYLIRAAHEAYEDTGYFVVHAGLDKERIDEALVAIKQELVKIARNGITREEYRRAHDNVRGRLILKFEKPSVYLTYLMGEELITKRVLSLEEKLATIAKVTIEDINRVAHRIISWKTVSLALIGPYRDPRRFQHIVSP